MNAHDKFRKLTNKPIPENFTNLGEFDDYVEEYMNKYGEPPKKIVMKDRRLFMQLRLSARTYQRLGISDDPSPIRFIVDGILIELKL